MKKLKYKLIFFLIIFFGLFGLAKSSYAATYYVRTDGNNNCNGSADTAGSSGGCAFRTVQKGIDTATSAGDIVDIRGDHSDEGLLETKADGCTGAGCATNPTYITIQTTPGAAQYSAIINPGIQINHSYVIVNGLGITGSFCSACGDAGVTFGWNSSPSHSKASNSHFYDPSESVGSSAIVFDGQDNIAEGNLIEGDTNPVLIGGHQTGANSTTLSDSYSASWTTNEWQGRRIWNYTPTDDSWAGADAGTVVSNGAHSLTTSLGVTWNTGDCYAIGSSFWIPVIAGGTDNTFRNNIIRNLANSERVFDGLLNGTTIENSEVYNLIDSNENRPDETDNCNAHTDLFQIVGGDSYDVTIQNNYFHDLEAQTGMMEGTNNHDWTVINNVFANITHRNTVFSAPNDKIWNNTFFNVAQSDQVEPLEGYSTDEEYKNNVIIGGSTNPDYGMIGGLIGDWVECAKNVITQTWQSNTALDHWIGQSGIEAILTANGSVYIGTGNGNTSSSQPNWSANCPNVGNICTDSGITWTNTAWNTTCVITGTKDVLFGDSEGLNRKNNVTSSFTCNPSAVPGGDPRIYDAEGIKTCQIKDSSDNPASNNYYGIWNPPTYGPRTQSLITTYIGDHNFLNGGNPKFKAAYTDCVSNSCDFSLQSGSPLIGAGTTLAGVTTDKNGVARPNPPSVGAYEYVSGSSDTTPPANPTGLSVN